MNKIAIICSALFGLLSFCNVVFGMEMGVSINTVETSIRDYEVLAVGKVLDKAIPVVCRFSPTNCYHIEIAPKNPMEQYNYHVIQLDATILSSIEKKLKNKQSSDSFGLLLQKEYYAENKKFPPILYAVDFKNFEEIKLKHAERWADKNRRMQEKMQGSILGDQQSEAQTLEEKEKLIGQKWLDYREQRSNRSLIATENSFIIHYSDQDQQPKLTYQEATLTVAEGCYYLTYVGKSITSTLEEKWLSVPMATRVLDEIRKKKEPFYMYAIRINKQAQHVEYAAKITSVIDKAPHVSSFKIIYGTEEGHIIQKSSYRIPFVVGGISVFVAFVCLIYRMCR